MQRFNQAKTKGFTLLEVIAVLLILSLLLITAIPKYLNLIDTSRKMAAQAAIAEIKWRLSQAQAKYIMRNGGAAPNGGVLYIYATNESQFGTNLTDVGNDFNVAFTKTTAPLTISVDRVKNEILANSVVGYFNAAGD